MTKNWSEKHPDLLASEDNNLKLSQNCLMKRLYAAIGLVLLCHFFGKAQTVKLINGDSIKQIPGQLVKDLKVPLQNMGLPSLGSSKFHVDSAILEATISYLGDTSMYYLNSPFSYAYSASVRVEFSQLPFDVGFRGLNSQYAFNGLGPQSFPKVNFNPQEYRKIVERTLTKHVQPDQLMAATQTRVNEIRQIYEKKLRQDLVQMQHDFAKTYEQKLEFPEAALKLEGGDISSLNSLIANGTQRAAYLQNQKLFGELMGMTNRSPQKDSLLNESIIAIKKYEAVQNMLTKVQAARRNYETNEWVMQLKKNLPMAKDGYARYLSNPGNLVDAAKENLSLNGIQRLFLNVTNLDLGTNPLQGDQYDFKDLLNSGINAGMGSNKVGVGMIYGSGTANAFNPLQAGLTNLTTNAYSQMAGVKLTSGWKAPLHQQISFNVYNFKNQAEEMLGGLNPTGATAMATPVRQDGVISYHTDFSIKAIHNIKIDLSKSFGEYSNQFGADTIASRKSAAGELFSNSGVGNYAMAFGYQTFLFKTSLDAFVQHAGLGYNNPGNIWVRKGEWKTGLGFSRKFLREKLGFKYRTSYSKQVFDPANTYSYASFQQNFQTSYRIRRNNQVSVQLRQESYQLNNKAAAMRTAGSNLGFQANYSYTLSFNKTRLFNHFMIGNQKFVMPMIDGSIYTTSNLMLTHNSIVAIGPNTIDLTISTNQSKSKDYFFNTTNYLMESHIGYAIGRLIHGSSGMGYYINNGWNQQLGLQQQIGGQLMKKINYRFDLSIRRATVVVRKELANQFYGTASISYRL